MTAWEFYIRHERRITCLIRKYAGKNDNLFDELWDEVIDRLPRIIELHADLSPEHQLAITMRNLAWYLWKRRNALAKQEAFEQTIQSYNVDLDSRIEVESILSDLSEEDAFILQCKDMYSLTFEEIGDALGISKSTARNRYNEALSNARRRTAD